MDPLKSRPNWGENNGAEGPARNNCSTKEP